MIYVFEYNDKLRTSLLLNGYSVNNAMGGNKESLLITESIDSDSIINDLFFNIFNLDGVVLIDNKRNCYSKNDPDNLEYLGELNNNKQGNLLFTFMGKDYSCIKLDA